MTIVGCDLHTRKQQVAVLHTDTGEVEEQELLHSDNAVEQFYSALPRPVTVGIESTGYALWFHELMQRLGHTLPVGEAAKIRAMVVRKTKTERRDAQHLLDLLKHDRRVRARCQARAAPSGQREGERLSRSISACRST
jgi:transposase